MICNFLPLNIEKLNFHLPDTNFHGIRARFSFMISPWQSQFNHLGYKLNQCRRWIMHCPLNLIKIITCCGEPQWRTWSMQIALKITLKVWQSVLQKQAAMVKRIQNLFFGEWSSVGFTAEIMGQIIGYQTSHEAWFALEKIFSTSSKARVMQFQTTKKRFLWMMDYIHKLKNLANNLAVIGEPVHNKDHILQLLGGLGVEYNSIVASLTAREDEVSLHTTHNILLTYEQQCNLCKPHYHIVISPQKQKDFQSKFLRKQWQNLQP